MSLSVKCSVGALEVHTLTDGVGTFEPGQFPATPAARIAELLAAAGKGAIETNFNPHLVQGGGYVTLVDTGARDLFGPRAGKLFEALDEIGCAAGDIDRIFLTHMHGDHCAGAITADGKAAFPGADLILSEAEYGFFSDAANFAGRGDKAKGAHRLAMAVFDAYRGRLETVSGAADLGGGLRMLPLHGHTAGHSGLVVRDGGETLYVVGDIVHSVDLQLADPEIAVMFDRDPDQARQARKAILSELAENGASCTGGHFLCPAIGRIEAASGGYRFVPCAG